MGASMHWGHRQVRAVEGVCRHFPEFVVCVVAFFKGRKKTSQNY
jgi:hypothetical protein